MVYNVQGRVKRFSRVFSDRRFEYEIPVYLLSKKYDLDWSGSLSLEFFKGLIVRLVYGLSRKYQRMEKVHVSRTSVV